MEVVLLEVVAEQTATAQKGAHAVADRANEPRDVRVGRRIDPTEPRRTADAKVDVHPVEHDRVEVRRDAQRRVAELGRDDRPGAATVYALIGGAPAGPAHDGADEQALHLTAQLGIVRERVS